MYLEYCLIANAAICILSLILFYFLKKKNQTNIKNTYTLVFCTVLAMICASILPLIADYLLIGLSFSIKKSLIVSFIILVAIALGAFYLLLPSFIKLIEKIEKNKEKTEDTKSDSIVEAIIEESAKSRPVMEENAGQTISDSEINKEAIPEENEAGSNNEPLLTEKSEDETQHIPEDPIYNEPAFTDIPVYNPDKESDISSLLDIAIESKINHNFQSAIAAYESALILNPDDELCYLIILDLCSLYKMTGNVESIYKLLDSARCVLLNSDRKEDILRNIKIS
jgi:tetratricopeptide (TPR) repeat protein